MHPGSEMQKQPGPAETLQYGELTGACFRGTLFLVVVTMDSQNITLSIPKDVLLSLKLIAVQRRTSVSHLLTQALERLVEQEHAYARAQRHHLEWLDRGVDLRTGGKMRTRREELHERL